MAMKEVQYINNYPICDAEARKQLANKEDKGHKHEEYATSAEVQQIFNSIDISDFDMSNYATKEDVEDAVANIEIPEVDLSNYATKDYVAEQIVNVNSDARLKRNINYFEDQEVKTMSDTVTADDVYNFFKDEIKIATYDMIPKGVDYKTVPENEDWGEEGNSTVGFIAQDIQDTKVGKLFVDENEEGILSYNSGAYQSLTVLALQKALKKIEELENRIHELENK